jgi:hypothetical protein
LEVVTRLTETVTAPDRNRAEPKAVVLKRLVKGAARAVAGGPATGPAGAPQMVQ